MGPLGPLILFCFFLFFILFMIFVAVLRWAFRVDKILNELKLIRETLTEGSPLITGETKEQSQIQDSPMMEKIKRYGYESQK